ncbi:NEDD4-binding protein 2-like 2 [Calypte anna]|uniref:NEDD4-binding protein 2-like 2 n=1 Tax=Calypte anna TaxID=9244 RepID=A0A091IKZ1_CALAN|nr:NEDD4-binding protein 2-like 2 [Calypte anna]
MLQAESKERLLECQDEITVEPSSKKLKSTDRACEKVSDYDNQDIQEELDAERTSNDLIPVYASDNQGQHEVQKQEKMPTGVLGTLSEVFPENNLVLSQPIDAEIVQNVNPAFSSINYAKVEDNKGHSITNNAGEDSNKNSSISSSVTRNASDEEFFTSKEFIGPIYKPAKGNKQDKSGSSNECGSSGVDQDELHEKKAKRKEAKKLHTVSSVVPEMDDELDQFYKEINQLENESLDTAFQEKEIETSQEQYSLPNCSQTSPEDHQHVLLGSPQPFYKNGQCFSGEQKTEKTSNEQQFLVEASGWKTENTFNGQVDSSVPEFRPAWQSAESFILPQGPFPPRINHQSHFLGLNSPHQKTNALPSHSAELLHKNYNGYHGNSNTNNHSLLFDQSANCEDIHTTHIFRNGNNDQNRLQNNDQNRLQHNGFCEAREKCWNDPTADNIEGMQGFSSMQLPKERFSCPQKWLLILRGLPGSGKSTLSRTLLGQSCDGIVLSTDDYFRQQDGYTYNAAHLGDAHDWNQKRAKQAMEQGKSPVIIDNTNTQAWEMKPYVQVALEKGYRVEFYEPDTWWKFDPEELEKRNKHGVTREKIAQMLERYEYQISIPIVMNSVVPPHKNNQRPPLQRRHRWGGSTDSLDSFSISTNQ